MIQLTQDANAKSEKIKERFLDPKVTEELIEYVPNQIKSWLSLIELPIKRGHIKIKSDLLIDIISKI